jgi:hypothetical protein
MQFIRFARAAVCRSGLFFLAKSLLISISKKFVSRLQAQKVWDEHNTSLPKPFIEAIS